MTLDSNTLSQKLGIESFNELKKLLFNQLSSLFDMSIEDIIYENDVIELPKPSEKYLKDNYEDVKKEGMCKLNQSTDNKIKGWRVLLSPDDKTICEKENWVKRNKNIIPSNIILRNKFDRGHLLAKMFKNYICVDIKPYCVEHNGTGTDFFSKKNEYNIVPLFKNANEGKLDHPTQVCYENQVYHLLDGNNQYKRKFNVYYEVQAVYANKDDEIPIGIRMLYSKLENGKFQGECVHVFVPNYYDHDDSRLISWKDYRKIYGYRCQN